MLYPVSLRVPFNKQIKHFILTSSKNVCAFFWLADTSDEDLYSEVESCL